MQSKKRSKQSAGKRRTAAKFGPALCNRVGTCKGRAKVAGRGDSEGPQGLGGEAAGGALHSACGAEHLEASGGRRDAPERGRPHTHARTHTRTHTNAHTRTHTGPGPAPPPPPVIRAHTRARRPRPLSRRPAGPFSPSRAQRGGARRRQLGPDPGRRRRLTSWWRRGTQPASASYSSGPSAILVLNPSPRCMPGRKKRSGLAGPQRARPSRTAAAGAAPCPVRVRGRSAR